MKLQGARITLDSQISALESAVVNIETFNAMKSGAQALKGIRGNMYVTVVVNLNWSCPMFVLNSMFDLRSLLRAVCILFMCASSQRFR
jgi:hypothetical protein